MKRFPLIVVGAAAALASGASAQNVMDDFSSGDDSAWTRIDGPRIAYGIPSTYSVLDGGYRLQGPAYPTNALQPTTSFRADSNGADVRITVDIAAYDDHLKQNISIGARLGLSSEGVYRFYEFGFTNHGFNNPALGALGIYRWNGDGTIDDVVFMTFPASMVNPAHDLRLEFTLDGNDLTGKLYDITVSTTVPLRTAHAVDTSPRALLTPGWQGVMVSSNNFTPGANPTDVTYDNFSVAALRRPCPGDWNHDGHVSSQDFFDFLSGFFVQAADFNGDGQTNSQDLFDFLNAFFAAGC